MKLCFEDLNKRIREYERDHRGVDLWAVPGLVKPMHGQLWLLEAPAAMSGREESWDADGTEQELQSLASVGLDAVAESEGTSLAVAMMDLPLFRFDGECWEVGSYTTLEQEQLRDVMPLGLMQLMREIMDLHLRSRS